MTHAPHDPEPHDIGCLQAIEAFYAYLDGELEDPASIADFEHHMQHCRSCFSRADMERAMTKRLRDAAQHRAPEVLRARLRKLIDKF
jgi:anti-sigma factor (TIGR02949 family)